MNRSLNLGAVAILALLLAGCVGAQTIGTATASPTATPPSSSEASNPTPIPTPKPTPAAPSGSQPPASAAFTPSGQLVAVLDVRCGPGAPVLSSDRVRASKDGVGLRVTGPRNWTLAITDDSGSDGVPLVTAAQAMSLHVAPGDVTVACSDPAVTGTPSVAQLRVEDPEGWYRSAAISNTVSSCMSANAQHGAGATGKTADPVQQAKEALVRGLRPGDVVERAGYPSDTGLVRVVRDGAVIGVLEYNADGHGGWLFMGSSLCGSLSAG